MQINIAKIQAKSNLMQANTLFIYHIYISVKEV